MFVSEIIASFDPEIDLHLAGGRVTAHAAGSAVRSLATEAIENFI